jgi:uracil-DNA glycosylase
VGLLAGGAQRTAAAMYASRNASPSPRRTDSAWFAKPVRYSDAYVTAAVRCAPPANKPLPEERDTCRPWLLRELQLLELL